MESADLRTGATDGDDFGVGGRVAGRGDLVPAFRHDDAFAHDHGSKWPTLVGAHALQREVDGALHEIFFSHTGPRIPAAQCPAMRRPIVARPGSPTDAM